MVLIIALALPKAPHRRQSHPARLRAMERRAKDHEKCALRDHFRALSLILLALLYVSLKEHSLPLGFPRLTLRKDKQDVTAQCTSRDPGKPEVTSGFLSLHSQAGDSWDWHTASFSR